MTIDLNSIHYDNYIENDVHNLFGLMQSKVTFEYLSEIKNVQPFILSRSTTVGSGMYSHHWSGDNEADYEYM